MLDVFSIPKSLIDPYLIHYNAGGKTQTLTADGANSRVAKSINAGSNTHAIAFQERIYLPDAQMQHYSDLAEMYIGDDVSPDFYAWVFPKCDHVAVGTRTASKPSLLAVLSLGYRFAEIDLLEIVAYAGSKFMLIARMNLVRHQEVVDHPPQLVEVWMKLYMGCNV